MKTVIPLSERSQTIQDAILASCELNCRYLWIDALCIIQDDAKDWAAEASKMRDVYRNSWITLIAEAANNTAQGFLRGRPRDESVHYDDPKPLHSLGWCLQEHLLAPRRLIYHIDHVSFACQSVSDDLSNCRMGATRSSDEKIAVWEQIITKYSKRQLTLEKDILPALSGLANGFRGVEEDIYLAGLWRSRLLPGLLWRRDDCVSNPGPSAYRAPSWTIPPATMALENPFEQKFISREPYPRESALQGRIIQRSLLRKVCEEDSVDFWIRRNNTDPEGYPQWIFGAEAIHKATGFKAMRDKSIHRLRNLGSKEIFANVYLDDLIPLSQNFIEKAFVLLIRTDLRQDDGQDDLGLVLILADGTKAYQRIGLFLTRAIDREKFFGENETTVEII
ncbi:MAG: hypothetical protein MMC33_004697 [Icmadophila ericetorum]|nr:hypothetical protein [Icmadophila ericetorum]